MEGGSASVALNAPEVIVDEIEDVLFGNVALEGPGRGGFKGDITTPLLFVLMEGTGRGCSICGFTS
jgi:hypothetical protein